MEVHEALRLLDVVRNGKWVAVETPRTVRLSLNGIVRWKDGRRGRMVRLQEKCESLGLRYGWTPEYATN